MGNPFYKRYVKKNQLMPITWGLLQVLSGVSADGRAQVFPRSLQEISQGAAVGDSFDLLLCLGPELALAFCVKELISYGLAIERSESKMGAR